MEKSFGNKGEVVMVVEVTLQLDGIQWGTSLLWTRLIYPRTSTLFDMIPDWTGIKFLRRLTNSNQDYVTDSSAYMSLSHDPTVTPIFVSIIKTHDSFPD